MRNKRQNGRLFSPPASVLRAGAVLLALGVWQLAAMLLPSAVLLASPIDVAVRLCTIWREPGFWGTLWFSFFRIVGGALAGILVGGALGALAGRFRSAELLLAPYMRAIRSVPVASFVILTLFFLSSSELPVFISFLMVLPVLYAGTLAGVRSADVRMLEAACVFRVPALRRVRFVYLPALAPHLRSSCEVALGLAWKAGIAAEVIGIPTGSVGEALYRAKIHLDTADLFAWTVLIVLLSFLFEKLFLAALSAVLRGSERL